jgi:hypothetical protein
VKMRAHADQLRKGSGSTVLRLTHRLGQWEKPRVSTASASSNHWNRHPRQPRPVALQRSDVRDSWRCHDWPPEGLNLPSSFGCRLTPESCIVRRTLSATLTARTWNRLSGGNGIFEQETMLPGCS